MLETFGEFWAVSGDAHVITTNGYVKTNGRCVMGRGVADQARRRFPGIDLKLGKAISDRGNCVSFLGGWTRADGRVFNIYSFPVKDNWWEKAKLELIRASCAELLAVTSGLRKVVLVRPGCGNGGLNWEEVKPICQAHFDNRYIIVERNKEWHTTPSLRVVPST